MTRWIRFITALIAFCALCTGAAAQVSTQLEVTGAVQQVLKLDAAALAASDALQIGTFTQTRASQEVETRSTVRGVKLSSLIERAGLSDRGRDGWKTLMVVATATDGRPID